MLKTILNTLFGLSLLLFGLNPQALAQERGNEQARTSPNASVSQTIGTTIVKISYGRPGVKGREVFGGSLVPYNKVWRTGANESTTITFSDDVTVQGEELSAGTYSLYTIPGEEEWTIIFNKNISWGTEYDESQDVLRVTTTAESADANEQLMFYFEDVSETSGTAVLRWDDVKVPFTIEV
ncbi:DUF2911 domain-containing protein [Fodinibius sediminis]|uniref:DUF2911 domain-containing protein n=1 Tax=Fodinibius sediminis TaxID=1214077 RepID=A0A521CG08_9BACT|nr:DUF2911 domain-containing protein [Fodinibius sediminis]SMO58356.1 Protein of unknown function [Fodinibius sediminis]